MKLYDKLIMLRKEKGWSQEDFAEKLDVSRQAISRWENGTALPDAQNILQISKLFGVSADYLLNDEYEGEADILTGETNSADVMPQVQKRKRPHCFFIPAICLILLLSASTVALAVRNAELTHVHPELTCVKENEVAATCTVEGSYDKVLYCAECGKEVFRTHIITERPAHQFQDEKCTVCGVDQREKQ